VLVVGNSTDIAREAPFVKIREPIVMTSATLPSSAAVIAFPPPPPLRFEAWREHWHRQVLADRELSHRDKSVAGLLIWYLNREERACFPSYATIARGVGITRRDAMRSVVRLVKRGHLQRQKRERQTNFYVPQVMAPCHQGGGTLPPGGGGKTATLTSYFRTSDSTLATDLDFEEGRSLPSGPRGPEGQKEKQEPNGASPSAVDPQLLLKTTAREFGRATPRNRRAWQHTSPQQAAEAEATLERYLAAAAKANGGSAP
jgi:hypothetical protein